MTITWHSLRQPWTPISLRRQHILHPSYTTHQNSWSIKYEEFRQVPT